MAFPSCGSGKHHSSSNRGSSSSYGQGAPIVRELCNGNFLVTYAGKSASFNKYGSRTSDSGMSGYERNQAQEAVDRYRREQSGSDNHSGSSFGGAPEIRSREDGKLEVEMPDGNVILYNKFGGMIQKGSGVSDHELNQANKAVQGYLREQRSGDAA